MNPDTNKQNPMNQKFDSPIDPHVTDLHVDDALNNFRLSLRAWSDHELTRRPAAPLVQPARPRSNWLLAPAVSWAAAAALAVAAVGVPLGVHHHNAVLAEQHAAQQAIADARQHQAALQQSAQIAANKADDDQLLQHVDTDIAQDTPDAMQPLASLMSSSGAE